MTTNGLIAFLFPGQGSQSVGMGKDLAEHYPIAKETFEEADDALGYKLSQICFEGPEDQLRLTEITQPAILTVSVAAWRVLNVKGLKPGFVAGHSLGEGAMAAILGMAPEKVAHVCHDAANGEVCESANINSPEQIVISGNTAAVERAAKLADERGAKRAKLLPVSAPFHCSLMKPAQDRLAPDLQALPFQRPAVPVVCNVDAAVIDDAERSRDALIRQVTGSVKWEQSIRVLIERGVGTFVEIGPGKVLCGLMRQIDRAQAALNVGDEASLTKTLEHFAVRA